MLCVQTAPFPTEQINAILDRATLKGSMIGVCVRSLEGETLYARNAETRLMPASNQKVLSVAYALWKLGPKYTPITKFWKTNRGLFIDSSGDPSMTYDRLVQARKRLGLAPKKKVFVKQAYRPGYGPGWEWDDLPNRSAPTISALSFNGASFELWGSPTKFWIKPGSFGIKIVHQSWRTGPNQFDLASKRLIVTGNRPKTESKIEAFALPNPDRLVALLFGGSYIESQEMPATHPMLTISGDSVAEMAKACLQPSDNFIAESLLMMAARAEGPLPEDQFGEASKRLKSFLVKTVGLAPEDVDPYDGSGLSRHNNVTAVGLVKVLEWTRKQPWADVWLNALAVPGVGTLKNRLQNCGFRGKTGTLDKASSLAGYVKCKDGRELVVSILMNHYQGGDSVARDAQDEIIRSLEASTKNGPVFAFRHDHADPVPDPNDRRVYGYWVRGPHIDGGIAQAGLDRRTQSDHARILGARRVEVRRG